jgi:signal transduction histidine kinase
MGIKPENLKLLFNEFSKVEDEANRKANPMGIGLGLAISYELAKLLGQNKNIGL